MSGRNEQSYDEIADEFSLSRENSSVDAEVVRFCELLKEGSRVLSVGCGTGLPSERYLADSGLKITGIDISRKLLDKARQNIPEGKFLKTDISEFETGEQFSGILAWWSLFHLQPEEHEIVFSKLHQLLEDDGYLLFNHGGSEGEITGEMFGHQFYYSSPGPEKIRQILEKLNFKILEWKVDESKENNHMVALVQK